jgi:hypothetical protein
VETKIIEAQQGPSGPNWGKFMVGRMTSEWGVRSAVDEGRPLLKACNWDPGKLVVFDLQTGEGAAFTIDPDYPCYELNDRHQIWVCPLFGPFLAWLFQQDLTDLQALPAVVNLPEAEFALRGYRRQRTGK